MSEPIVVPIQTAQPYSVLKTVGKGLRAAAVALGSIAATGALDAVISALSNQAVVVSLLPKTRPELVLLAPVVAGIFDSWRNRRKQKAAAAA